MFGVMLLNLGLVSKVKEAVVSFIEYIFSYNGSKRRQLT